MEGTFTNDSKYSSRKPKSEEKRRILEFDSAVDVEKILYWSNSCGELHQQGRDISENELPQQLKEAYYHLWNDASGSLEYLVEFEGNYYLALINEFDWLYGQEDTYELMKEAATEMYQHLEFEDTILILGESTGFDERHETIVLFPAANAADPIEQKRFHKIEELLYRKLDLKDRAEEFRKKNTNCLSGSKCCLMTYWKNVGRSRLLCTGGVFSSLEEAKVQAAKIRQDNVGTVYCFEYRDVTIDDGNSVDDSYSDKEFVLARKKANYRELQYYEFASLGPGSVVYALKNGDFLKCRVKSKPELSNNGNLQLPTFEVKTSCGIFDIRQVYRLEEQE